MEKDARLQVNETHTQLFDLVQKEFGQLIAAVQEAELNLVKRCQGLHEGITGHCNQRHLRLAGKADPEFIHKLDGQGEELVRIVQTRFAELTRDLKHCHGGACQILNRRGAQQILDMSLAGR
jgi:hypothetical protein